MERCAGDAVRFLSQHMANPSPSPPHDDGVRALLFAAGKKISVRDGLRLEYPQDTSEVLGVEGGKFV